MDHQIGTRRAVLCTVKAMGNIVEAIWLAAALVAPDITVPVEFPDYYALIELWRLAFMKCRLQRSFLARWLSRPDFCC